MNPGTRVFHLYFFYMVAGMAFLFAASIPESSATLSCLGARTIQCGQTIHATNAGGSNGVTQWPCFNVDDSGPEKVFVLDLAQDYPILDVTLDTLVPYRDLDLFILGSCDTWDYYACLSGGDDEHYSSDMTAGRYYLVVDGNGGDTSDFNLTVECLMGTRTPTPRPSPTITPTPTVTPTAAMTCLSAPSVSCGGTYHGTTRGMTNGAGTYSCISWAEGGPEAVHEWVVPQRYDLLTVTLQSENPAMDMFFLRSCNEWNCFGYAFQQAWFGNLAPGTYYIVVDAPQGVEGDYNLLLACADYTPTPTQTVGPTYTPTPLPTLDCSQVTDLQCNWTVRGSTTGGINHVTYYPCEILWEENAPEQVFRFTTPDPYVRVVFSLDTLDPLDLFVLRDCGDINSCFAVNGNEGHDRFVEVPNLAAGTYYVVVDGWLGATGDFNLSVECFTTPATPTPAWNCGNAEILNCGDRVWGTNSGGHNSVQDYSCFGFPERGPEKLYSLSLAAPARLTADLNILTFDQDLDLFLLSACDANLCMASGILAGALEHLVFDPAPAGNYYLVVEGFAGSVGDYTLTLGCGPAATLTPTITPTLTRTPTPLFSYTPTETPLFSYTPTDTATQTPTVTPSPTPSPTPTPDCSSATDIPCGASVQGTTSGAPNRLEDYSCAAWEESGPELLYRLELPQAMNLTAAISNAAWPLDVFILGVCSSQDCVAFGVGEARAAMAPAGTYLIVVEGYPDYETAFTLTVQCDTYTPTPQPTLDCTGAPLIACGQTVNGSNETGTNHFSSYPCAEIDIFQSAENVWQLDVATDSLTTLTFNDIFNRFLFLMLFASCDLDQCVGMMGSGSWEVSLAAGTYYLVVDGAPILGMGGGPYSITVNCAPPGRIECGLAREIHCGDVITGNTTTSPSNANAYPCGFGGYSGPEDVYSLILPSPAHLIVGLPSTEDDEDILFLDACDIQHCLAWGNDHVDFENIGPGNYYVIVDGSEGAQGAYTLEVLCTPLPSSTPTLTPTPLPSLTPTPAGAPHPFVAAGGYWDMALTQRGGTFKLWFYILDPQQAGLDRLEWGGLVLRDSTNGVFSLEAELAPGLPEGRFLFQTTAYDNLGRVSALFPYLVVP